MTPENRNLIMAVALSMVVLFGWQILVIHPEMEKEAAEQERIMAEMAESSEVSKSIGKRNEIQCFLIPRLASKRSQTGPKMVPKRCIFHLRFMHRF